MEIFVYLLFEMKGEIDLITYITCKTSSINQGMSLVYKQSHPFLWRL